MSTTPPVTSGRRSTRATSYALACDVNGIGSAVACSHARGSSSTCMTATNRKSTCSLTSPEDVPPFTFNCDIATPMVRRGDAVFAGDLWLNVLVRADGVTYGARNRPAQGHSAGRPDWRGGAVERGRVRRAAAASRAGAVTDCQEIS
jgi:hypothetical protein